MELTVTTKQSDLDWGTGSKEAVRYLPAPNTKQMFLYKSSKTGRHTWTQVTIEPGLEDYRGRVRAYLLIFFLAQTMSPFS